jgi:hypothetical protein
MSRSDIIENWPIYRARLQSNAPRGPNVQGIDGLLHQSIRVGDALMLAIYTKV